MIGVLGGAGVAATNKLCELIENEMTQNGAFRDAHHPEMIIWQATKVPSRSLYYEGRGETFIPEYIRIGKQLKECGATKLIMCCNTAHMALNEIQSAVGVPFIDVLEEVALKVNELRKSKVGIICSDSLSKSRLYDQYIKKSNACVETFYPDDYYQRKVTLGICNAKNMIRFRDSQVEENHPSNLFSQVVRHLESKNVDLIIAGCTDVRNVYKPNLNELRSKGIEYLDCLEIMANSIIREEIGDIGKTAF